MDIKPKPQPIDFGFKGFVTDETDQSQNEVWDTPEGRKNYVDALREWENEVKENDTIITAFSTCTTCSKKNFLMNFSGYETFREWQNVALKWINKSCPACMSTTPGALTLECTEFETPKRKDQYFEWYYNKYEPLIDKEK